MTSQQQSRFRIAFDVCGDCWRRIALVPIHGQRALLARAKLRIPRTQLLDQGAIHLQVDMIMLDLLSLISAR